MFSRILAISCLWLAFLAEAASAQNWYFEDVTLAAGIDYEHGYNKPDQSPERMVACGVAAGDYDNDGWVDLYVVRGNIGPNLLFRNRGDGTFDEVGAAAGVGLSNTLGSGPVFGDVNGDGWLDLFVGGVQASPLYLFLNRGDGTFEDVSTASGIVGPPNSFSATFGDPDRDGDLDLFMTHWNDDLRYCHLWKNRGDGTFLCGDASMDLETFGHPDLDFTFVGNFADIDSDGWSDLLVVSDFGRTQVFRNEGGVRFANVTDSTISDENGMGSTVGDYDNDGDLDWFVTSIWDDDGVSEDGIWGRSGNRLYRNRGDGTFEDATDEAGVREGDWGWAASFADFNNDGYLDLYHVNGWPFQDPTYAIDPARMFIANGDGTFTERANQLKVDHHGQGRGISCFDYDRDGDLDMFIANNSARPVLYRNNFYENGGDSHYLAVVLRCPGRNVEGIGARVYAHVGAATLMRELRAGSNFVSQDPAIAHFGLGTATKVDRLRIVWPDGEETQLEDVAANQRLVVRAPDHPVIPASSTGISSIQPNPFTDTTQIAFFAAQAGSATLRVYSLTGRLVRTIEVSSGPSGILVWDGRDDAGRSLAAGAYVLKLETAGGDATARATLIR